MALDSNLLKQISQSKFFHDRISNRKEPQNPWAIQFCHIWIHDWKPFFQNLLQRNVPVSLIMLGINDDPSTYCPLTKMGAETLGWVLNPKKSGLSIEAFSLNSQNTSRSIHRKWMHGMMSDDDQERIICDLDLDIVPSWFLPDLVLRRNCKIQKLDCQSRVGDDGAKIISFAMRIGNARHNVSADVNRFFQQAKHGVLAKDWVGAIHTMEINLGDDTTPAACHSLGVLLSSTRLQTLTVDIANFKKDVDYNLLFKSAKRCGEIVIRESPNDNDSDLFPCDGLTSWMESTCGIFLKSLTFEPNQNENIGQRNVGLEKLLKKATLSSLETFYVDPISISDGAFSALCHQLEANKGPQHLHIEIDSKYRDKYDRGDCENDNEAFVKLGKSLRGNDKIKELDILMINLDLAAVILLRFVQIVCEDMPSLTCFRLQNTFRTKRISVSGGEKCDDGSSDDDDDDDDDKDEEESYDFDDCEYALEISTKVEEEHKMKKMILQLISKSKTITHVSLPFHDEGLGFLMEEIAKFRPLLLPRDRNAVPDGIWSHALDCTNIVIPDVMFYVLQRMPSLLQRIAGNDDNLLPMFVVPHHRNCPACQREDGDGKVCVLQGRYP